MKYIFLNLKRFDIPKNLGGINTNDDVLNWGGNIIRSIDDNVKKYKDSVFVSFLPEAHIISAIKAKSVGSMMNIGSQSLHWADVEAGGNFGAFTTSRTAKSIKSIGCNWTIIGHCEERRDLRYILSKAGTENNEVISKILNEKVKTAVKAGLKVLYCVGESQDEQADKYNVIKNQIELGLDEVDKKDVVIAYEPVWAIGPGKTPPDEKYIDDIAKYIKSIKDVPVVYGGGLKQENAAMLASINSIDGGLIALTRFSGDIGFYSDEYADIVSLYLGV